MNNWVKKTKWHGSREGYGRSKSKQKRDDFLHLFLFRAFRGSPYAERALSDQEAKHI